MNRMSVPFRTGIKDGATCHPKFMPKLNPPQQNNVSQVESVVIPAHYNNVGKRESTYVPKHIYTPPAPDRNIHNISKGSRNWCIESRKRSRLEMMKRQSGTKLSLL